MTKQPDDPGDDGKGDEGKKNNSGDGTATLYWSLNKEANGGAFYGGCNFLSAGKAKDSGSARVWPSGGGGFYKSKSGNVTIQKPTGSTFKEASWDSRCLDSRARPSRPPARAHGPNREWRSRTARSARPMTA
jgi:hypothetical protein